MLNASTSQQGQRGNTGTGSREVNTAIGEAMDAMFKVLGACIQQFGSKVAVAAPVFDIAATRKHTQSVFTGTLKAGENHWVLEHTFASDDELILGSTGKTKLSYFLAASAHSALNGHTVVAVDEEESRQIIASAFGDLSLRFLHVINTSPNAEGHFKFQIK